VHKADKRVLGSVADKTTQDIQVLQAEYSIVENFSFLCIFL